MTKKLTDNVYIYVDHEEVGSLYTMRYDLDSAKILLWVHNIDCIEKFIERQTLIFIRGIHGFNPGFIIMQDDANRCSLDVIKNETEEKLLRSKDNLAGTKIDH